jgi:hypothetical protein
VHRIASHRIASAMNGTADSNLQPENGRFAKPFTHCRNRHVRARGQLIYLAHILEVGLAPF